MNKARWAVAYNTCVMLTASTVGLLMILWGPTIAESNDQTNPLMQVVVDWQTVPFVNIAVTEQTTCPEGTELVLSRDWYGLYQGCDCLNADLGKFQIGPRCADNNTSKQKYRGCVDASAHAVVRQGQFSGKRVCGARGGLPFLTVTRVDKSGKCPDGTEPCISGASADNTICYPQEDLAASCPITKLAFKTQAEISALDLTGYIIVPFDQTQSIVYSKEVDSLPITKILLEDEPCMDSFMQSATPGQLFYATEMQRQSEGCLPEKNTGLVRDPRYESLSFQTNEFDVQTENGVISILLFSPAIFNFLPTMEVKSSYEYTAWGRPTINWSVDCEHRGISREIGFDTFQTGLFPSENATRLTLVGWVLLCLSLCCTCQGVMASESYVEDRPGELRQHEQWFICSRLTMWIMFTFVFLRLYGASNDMKDNLDRVNPYSVLPECADEYTQMDTDTLRAELTEASQYTTVMIILSWVVAGLFICEVALVFISVLRPRSLCSQFIRFER